MVMYNYAMLILQIYNRPKDLSNQVGNEPEKDAMGSSEQFNKSVYTQQTPNTIKKVDTKTAASNLFDMTTLRVPSNRLEIKTNASNFSMYEMKRPQIIRPERIKRKHHKTKTHV